MLAQVCACMHIYCYTENNSVDEKLHNKTLNLHVKSHVIFFV